MNGYFLAFLEVAAGHDPVHFQLIRPLKSNLGQGWWLAQISPPMMPHIFKTRAPLSEVIARDGQNYGLMESQWPTRWASVVLYRSANELSIPGDSIATSDLIFVDKGFLFRTREEALPFSKGGNS